VAAGMGRCNNWRLADTFTKRNHLAKELPGLSTTPAEVFTHSDWETLMPRTQWRQNPLDTVDFVASV